MSMMLSLPRWLLVCLVVALVLPAVASADETDKANRLIDKTSPLLERNAAQYKEILDLVTRAEQIDPASKQAAEARTLLDEAAALLEEQTRQIQSVAALVDEAKALDVGPEFKVYLGQERELMQVNLDLYAVIGEWIATDKTAYAKWGRLSDLQRNALLTKHDDLVAQAATLEGETQEKQAAAVQYYKDNAVGEQSSGSSIYFPGVLVFATVGLAVGWYIRRQRHRGPTNPKSLDEEMKGV